MYIYIYIYIRKGTEFAVREGREQRGGFMV